MYLEKPVLLEKLMLLEQLKEEMRPSDYLHKIIEKAEHDGDIRETLERSAEIFHQARAATARIDFSHVRAICQRMYGWSERKTVHIQYQYEVFWGICAIGLQREIYETLDVDNFWHVHVLHTQEYREDCKSVFGRFLEHVPCL
jgi:hypothetical protein